MRLGGHNINPKYTFDCFIVGNCNRLAHGAAMAVAENPGNGSNPLFLYGGVGLGKTHLLQAIGHAALANNLQVLYVSAEQFTSDFVNAIRQRKTEAFYSKYRNVDMLLIDDIHFADAKDQTGESFFRAFNALDNADHQIVITGDCPPKSPPLLEGWSGSCFERGRVVDIQSPDFETRLGILQAKAEQNGVTISLDTLEFIGHRVQQNVRKLEASLNRVIAYAKLIKVSPTPEIAAKALEDIAFKQPEITFIVNADEKITLISEEGCKALSYKEEELIGKNWFNTLVPEEERKERRRDFHKVWAGDIEPVEPQENPLLTKDKKKRLIMFRNTVIRDPNSQIAGVLLSGEDITELRRVQEQRQHARLLASLGNVTAGISHEVNNPLASILLYSEAAMKGNVSPETRKDLEVIRDEAKRASKIMRRLFTSSLKRTLHMRRSNLHNILKKALNIRRYEETVQNISISVNLMDTPLYIRGDSSQLRYVFMNLMLNAEEVLQEQKGGNIVITTQIEGDKARVSIADDGTGIPEEKLNQIFHPFFTSKEVGKGIGLGLSSCYGIVAAHGGLIRAENNEMGGATFIVEIPLA